MSIFGSGESSHDVMPLMTHVTVRVFGKRYREVVRGWEASVRAGGTNDRRYVTSLPFLCPTFIPLTE